MRLLFVVQRYGPEIAGGAELTCRQFATRLARRGHDVEVLTSCAVSYVDWANVYSSGAEEVDGVVVHRLPVVHARQDRLFAPLHARVFRGMRPAPLHLQRDWIRMQGPDLPGVVPWLAARARSYDVVVFFTYLYYPTWAGLPVAAAFAATVLHPLAHDEPPLYLPLFDTMFRHPSAFAFSTQEEQALVARRFSVRRPSAIVAIGVDLDAGEETEEAAFRAAFGLGHRPYLLFVGRLDPAKGAEELWDFFVAYKRRNPGALALVMVGDPILPPPAHPDVVVTGFVSERFRDAAFSGALALVQPSYFESFSLVLMEAWAKRRPALVQGYCPVLESHARRSEAGIPYRGFAEFEAALDRFVADEALRYRLGAAGLRYVEEHYGWPRVLEAYERLLSTAAASPSVLPRLA